MEVTLAEMLAAREVRAERQRVLGKTWGLPLISFSMNIPGPVKNGPAIRRAFREGMDRLTDLLAEARLPVSYREEKDAVTGCEALLVVRGEAGRIKALCLELEDTHPLGRLFDMDVLGPEGQKMDREALGRPPRPCLVCGERGRGCASRRVHSLAELGAATDRILRGFFGEQDGSRIDGMAVRALLYEVCTTPKPGLVDRTNSGSHRDMDLFTFLDSVAALIPYFRRAAAVGMETADRSPEEAFSLLRREGLKAEREMGMATGGVNTHKGAIYSMGIVCAAAGRLWSPERPFAPPEQIMQMCGELTRQSVQADFAAVTQPCTAGQRLYRSLGMTGIRGEMAAGLPSVGTIGLPALRQALAEGADLEQAGVTALLRLMARVADTNLAARGGPEGQKWAAEAAAPLDGRDRAAVEALDREMIRRNLSPGGCADLLAITYFFHFWEAQE